MKTRCDNCGHDGLYERKVLFEDGPEYNPREEIVKCVNCGTVIDVFAYGEWRSERSEDHANQA